MSRKAGSENHSRMMWVNAGQKMLIRSHRVEAGFRMNETTGQAWQCLSKPLTDQALVRREDIATDRIGSAEIVASVQRNFDSFRRWTGEWKSVDQPPAIFFLDQIDGEAIFAIVVHIVRRLKPVQYLPSHPKRQTNISQESGCPWPRSDHQMVCLVAAPCGSDADERARLIHMPAESRLMGVEVSTCACGLSQLLLNAGLGTKIPGGVFQKRVGIRLYREHGVPALQIVRAQHGMRKLELPRALRALLHQAATDWSYNQCPR